MDMINIGYSGASTAQVELNVTAQNTANAMTTGYTRQVAEISTIGASGGSPNSAGNGVQVDSIRRVSNQYQVNQVWYAASDYGYYSTQQGYLSQLEAVLSDDNSSLSGGFDNFFAAFNEATTSPDDSALREQVISEAGRCRCVLITRWITSTRKARKSSASSRRWCRKSIRSPAASPAITSKSLRLKPMAIMPPRCTMPVTRWWKNSAG